MNSNVPNLQDEEGAATGRTYRGKAVRMDNSHTGEEVIVAAQGPGSNRVRGYMPNTQIFHIMMQAYGWNDGESQK